MSSIVSIIVPVYNVEKYLKKCLDSIIKQTYENLEIILVDDGSTDSSGIICDEYALKDDRIKVIHKKNGGLSDARNVGIDNANGSYLCCIDSDDYVDEEMIQRLYNSVIANGADMSICNFLEVDDNGIVLPKEQSGIMGDGVLYKNEFYSPSNIKYFTVFTVAWNKLYKREIFDDIRYPYGKIHEDEFVVHKIFDKCNVISCVEKPMYYYLQRSNSIAHSKFSVRKLDLAEALLDQTEYALFNSINALAEKAFCRAVGVLILGYNNIDFNNECEKKRLYELKSRFDDLYPKVKNKIKLPIKRLSLSIFRLNPYISYIFYKAYKLLRR